MTETSIEIFALIVAVLGGIGVGIGLGIGGGILLFVIFEFFIESINKVRLRK